MKIFKEIGKSIYGPEFYADLANQSTRSSIKYYLKFILLLSLVSTIILSAIFIPFARSMITEERVAETISLYPAELTLKTKDGVFVTDVVEPYKIALKDVEIEEDQPENLVVIDTKIDAVSLSSFEAYSTSILINKDSVIAIDNGSLKVTPVAKYFKDGFELNQTTIQSYVTKFLPIVRTFVWFSPVLIYVAMYFVAASTLVAIFFWALFVWLLLRLIKKNQGYKHAYRVTIHAITLALIVTIFTDLPSFVNLLIILLVVIVNFRSKKPDVVAPEAPVQTPAI